MATDAPFTSNNLEGIFADNSCLNEVIQEDQLLHIG